MRPRSVQYILEVEDERELVDDQCCADAEGDRDQVAYRAVRARGCSQEEAADEHDDDSRHDVVEMNPTDAAASPSSPPCESRVEPRQEKGDQEAQEQQEERFLPGLVDVLLIARHESEDVHALASAGRELMSPPQPSASFPRIAVAATRAGDRASS
jgi:hypothetical protein